MPARKPAQATHTAVLADGSKQQYQGAHPTHWSFGGVDKDGKPDGSPVRVVPVLSVIVGPDPVEDE